MRRELYLQVPNQGVEGHGAAAGGTIVKAEQSVYGLSDAPFE